MAATILSHNLSESRDVVFCPNLMNSPTFGAVYDDFMGKRGEIFMESWTCKKTAKPGDLYLFYFGEPKSRIAGLAICRESPDPEGWKKRGWNNRQKMFFCPWDMLYHCDAPVSGEELRTNRVYASWWATKPYRGRPKTVPSEIAAPLLRLIAKREHKIATLLNGYIDDRAMVATNPKRAATVEALEGTSFERLCQTRLRSRALRDEKIRQSMESTGGRLVCEVPRCGFDFLDVYGEPGRGLAHVHHRRLLAERKRVRTKLADLAIVCANCHAMIHYRGQCRAIQSLIPLR